MYRDDSTLPPAEVTPPEVIPPGGELGEEAHIHLSPTSIWPITMAFGIAVIGLGVVSVIQLTPIGIGILILALYFWIQELRHEYL